MVSEKQDIHAIFNEAIVLASEEDQLRYLEQACGGDLQMRARVDALLHAHSEAGGFFGGKQAAADATRIIAITEHPGTTIGPYKLLQQIGEGGMGVVFMAEQSEPIQRTVALKIIKPGMDTRQVIARFEAERQALAMMEHPSIAKVLDAGATASGRPYFVMELVQGVPITDYCDKCSLTTRQRLQLFMAVCQAVQHAHQKGLIHRDIKPTNVLVAMQDGKPAPKIIDFGVAKAVNQQLTELTLITAFAQMVGTPLYMSPEQAELSALGVDTRSDIYSLGVLLYELLTGATPFDPARLKDASFDEWRRIIRQEEPPQPSARLSTLAADMATTIADRRRTDARRLYHSVRGDLDWIVMKCLDKDRNRRYESASGLAQDIQRYLANEPVEASPPSITYRFGKFIRRNKPALAVATALSLLVLMTIVGLIVNNRLMTREKEQKEIALARALQEKSRADQNLSRARHAVKEFLIKTSENPLLQSGDFFKLRSELLETAIPFYLEFVRQRQDDPTLEAERGLAYEDLAFLRQETGDLDRALRELEQTEQIFRRLSNINPEQPEYRQRLAEVLNSRGAILHDLGRLDDAELSYRQAIEGLDELVLKYPAGDEYRNSLARTSSNLGLLLKDSGRLDEAETMLRRAIAIREELIALKPAMLELRGQLAQSWLNLGSILHAQRRFKLAEQAFLDALKSLDPVELKKLTPDSELPPKYQQVRAQSLNNVGNLYRADGRLDDAESAFRQALTIKEKLARKFPSVPQFSQELARSFSNMGIVLLLLERPADAQAAFEKSISIYERLASEYRDVPMYAVEVAGTYSNLGRLLGDQGQLDESLPVMTKSIEMLEAAFHLDQRLVKVHESLLVAHWTRAMTLAGLGRFAEALADWDRAIELDDGQHHNALRIKRASNLLNMKDHARATADAQAVAEYPQATGEDLYAAACAYAVSAQLAADNPSLAESYAARAVTLLRQAMVKGYEKPARMDNDTDLHALRSREDFRKLIGEVVEEPSESDTD